MFLECASPAFFNYLVVFVLIRVLKSSAKWVGAILQSAMLEMVLIRDPKTWWSHFSLEKPSNICIFYSLTNTKLTLINGFSTQKLILCPYIPNEVFTIGSIKKTTVCSNSKPVIFWKFIQKKFTHLSNLSKTFCSYIVLYLVRRLTALYVSFYGKAPDPNFGGS